MKAKYTLDQFKDSKTYEKYDYILDTILDPKKKYTTAEVDAKLVTYIERS